MTSLSGSRRATSSGSVGHSAATRALAPSPADSPHSPDPLTARYSRYNKSGCITSSPVTSILWLPPAPPTSPTSPAGDNGLTSPRSNLFVTSHADGSIVLWDKDKEDWNGFLAQPFPAPASVANTPGHGGGGFARGSEWSSSSEGGATRGEGGGGKVAAGQEDMVVSRPPTTADRKGQSTAKFNPVAHWRLSKKAITGALFPVSAPSLKSST